MAEPDLIQQNVASTVCKSNCNCTDFTWRGGGGGGGGGECVGRGGGKRGV